MSSLLLEILLKNYQDNQTDENLKTALSMLRKLSLADLSSYCKNPLIKTLLDQPGFDLFWQEKLNAFTIKRSPDFRFLKSENLTVQELTLGVYHYRMGMKNPNTQDANFELALSFHSFHTLKQIVTNLCDSIKKGQFTQFGLLPQLVEQAKWHGTPGYLLIALIYLNLALHLSSEAERREAAVRNLFTYLELAKLAHENSVNAIHNAYYSEGLVNSIPGFKFNTIGEMINACRELVSKWMPDEMISLSFNAAKLVPPFKPQQNVIPQEKFSVFYQAILADSPELIRAHFSHDQLEKRNSWGESPLLFAVRHGKIKSVRCLLALGANVHAVVSVTNSSATAAIQGEGYNALQIALQLKNRGICRVLVDHTADGKISQTAKLFIEQEEPIFYEAEELQRIILNVNNKLSFENISKLLNTGLNPNQILPSGKTALSCMLSTGNVAGVRLFMDYGSSVNQPDANGETVLFDLLETNEKTSREYRENYFRHFVHLGANINAKNNQGETLLIKAVKNNAIENVDFLLQQKGIDIDVVDNLGNNASFYAANNSWILRLLEDASKRQSPPGQTSGGSNGQDSKVLFFSKEKPVAPGLPLPYEISAFNCH